MAELGAGDAGLGPKEQPMLSEIQDAVEFLSGYLSAETGEGMVPRRKVLMFSEQLTSALLHRFRGLRWDPARPELDQDARVLEVKVHGFTSPLVEAAAEAVGLPVGEALAHLPDALRLYVNPQEVLFSIGAHGVRQQVRPATHRPPKAQMVGGPNALHGPFARLAVDEGRRNGGGRETKASPDHSAMASLNSAVPLPGAQTAQPAKVHEPGAQADVKFTVASFATTRFGTAKQKSSLALMKQIQAKVKEEPGSPSSQPLASSSPPPGLGGTGLGTGLGLEPQGRRGASEQENSRPLAGGWGEGKGPASLAAALFGPPLRHHQAHYAPVGDPRPPLAASLNNASANAGAGAFHGGLGDEVWGLPPGLHGLPNLQPYHPPQPHQHPYSTANHQDGYGYGH